MIASEHEFEVGDPGKDFKAIPYFVEQDLLANSLRARECCIHL